MAVNVTQLAAALRLGDGVTAPDEPLLGILTRLLGVGDATVALLAPDAPDVIKDEAVINYAAQLYDKPSAASGNRYAAAWLNSGAASLVASWVVRRIVADVDSDSDSAGTAPPSGTGVSESRINQLIDAAIMAHTAIVAAHHEPGTGTPGAVLDPITVVNAPDGRLPAAPVAMRIGWSQTTTFSELSFDRPIPPTGGSTSGLSDELATPPFPPSLNTDSTLYMGIWLEGNPKIAAILSNQPGGESRTRPIPDSRCTHCGRRAWSLQIVH